MDRHFPCTVTKLFFCRMAVLMCFCAGWAYASGDCPALPEKSEFDSARACLKKALAKKPRDQNLQLANAKLMASASAARAVYKKLIAAVSCPDTVSAEAYYYMACHSYMMANYAKAEQYCREAYTINRKDIYKNMYARCARQNNHDSLSQALLRDSLAHEITEGHDTLQQDVMMEKGALKQAVFLQAGAFGALENAQALRTELKRFCTNVAVIAAISNDKNIYRVRIGAFDSKESAQAFGDSALAKRNISFRIVVE
jgi:tetratricopeptide (TPR) repeat protein